MTRVLRLGLPQRRQTQKNYEPNSRLTKYRGMKLKTKFSIKNDLKQNK